MQDIIKSEAKTAFDTIFSVIPSARKTIKVEINPSRTVNAGTDADTATPGTMIENVSAVMTQQDDRANYIGKTAQDRLLMFLSEPIPQRLTVSDKIWIGTTRWNIFDDALDPSETVYSLGVRP